MASTIAQSANLQSYYKTTSFYEMWDQDAMMRILEPDFTLQPRQHGRSLRTKADRDDLISKYRRCDAKGVAFQRTSPATYTSLSQRLHFLNLPFDIRCVIYSYLIPDRIVVAPFSGRPADRRCPFRIRCSLPPGVGELSSLLLVCKAPHAEIQDRLDRTVRFEQQECYSYDYQNIKWLLSIPGRHHLRSYTITWLLDTYETTRVTRNRRLLALCPVIRALPRLDHL